MSVFRSCDFSRLSGRDARTAFSSRATWASGSFSSRSPGKRSASMSGGVRPRCESTTGLRTRSERRPIGCWVPKCPTWTAIRKTARARSQRSTVRRRTSWSWILPRKRSRLSANGWRNGRKEGIVPHEIGVFVRSAAELDRARAAVEDAKLPYKVLDDNVETTSGRASISTMHLAKGLEFRTVVVMACDDEVIPLQERIETVADDADLEEVYNTERHLLYVACTRARDHLLVTGVEPASEFLDDLRK